MTWLLPLFLCAPIRAQQARIEVHADRILHAISPTLTGACIEDVNHEIYGGLYSQMLFGESFQEPPITTIPGFTTYGGTWKASGEELVCNGEPGDRIVSGATLADGEVDVEVFVPDRHCRNAGLIVRVNRPGRGIDNFEGYEIALNAEEQSVRLGRHRHNWEPILDAPCAVPIGRWVPLRVVLTGPLIEVSVDGVPVIRHHDGPEALLSGSVGLRQFQPAARYRRLQVRTAAQTRLLPFVSDPDEAGEVSGMWRPMRAGDAVGRFALVTDPPFVGRQSQRLTFVQGRGRIGVENHGLNRQGLALVAGRPYEAVLWARAEAPTELVASLESGDGNRSLAEHRLAVKRGVWQRLAFTLAPNATERMGRLTLSLRCPGSVDLGYASLQPGAWGRFRRLPVRRDVAEALVAQGITVLRYGGSMVNAPEYRWKQMIGPRDRRAPYHGAWYPYSSNGWGILDFLDLCERAGFAAVPDLNINETPQDLADFVEYVNGPVTSPWGHRRAADGHPAPYGLRYLELGNEERVDDRYAEQFAEIAKVVWAKDPGLILIVGDLVYDQPIEDPMHFRGAGSGITSLRAHQQILQLARDHDREVWFDVHVGTDGPRPDATLAGMFSFQRALRTLVPGARHRVVVFEMNADNHSQRRALANALAIQAILRNGEIPITTSANGLQPDGQNDNGWNQGLLFLNPSQVWLQPPGYVTQMIAHNALPLLVPCTVTDGSATLDAIARRSADGRKLLLQVVNPTDHAVDAVIRLTGFSPRNPAAQILELVGNLDAVNTAEHPAAIVPQSRRWRHGLINGETHSPFPAYSVTVLNFE